MKTRIKSTAIDAYSPGPTEKLAATRCGFANTVFNSGQQATMGRSEHIATSDITHIRLCYAGFYKSVFAEQGHGVVRIFRASVEYPIGSPRKRIGFETQSQYGAGRNTGYAFASLSTGGNRASTPKPYTFSKLVRLPTMIPKGATFYVYSFDSGLNSLYTAGRNTNDITNFGPLATMPIDNTLTSTMPTNGLSAGYRPPALILSPGADHALMSASDSIGFGVGDSVQGDQRNGIVLRSAVAGEAHLQLGVPGARSDRSGSDWSIEAPSHLRMLPYATTIIHQLATNDINNSALATTVRDQALAYLNDYYWTAKKKFILTMLPITTSTDDWYTTGNQTPSFSTQRNAYNDLVRAGIAGFDGYFDIAVGVETTLNSNVWAPYSGARSLVDVNTTAASAAITSTLASFTQADVGWGIAIDGAGASGGVMRAYIATVTDGTHATLSVTASTTTTLTTARLGTPTLDGTHPVPAVHVIGGANIDHTQVV